MKTRDYIKRRIRMMHNDVERIRAHLYDIWIALGDEHPKSKEEIAVFTKMLEEVDRAIDKLKEDIVG